MLLLVFMAAFVILSIRLWFIVVMKQFGCGNWIREDPLVHPYRWLRPDLVPLAPFLQCEPHLTPDGSGVLSDPNLIDAEF